MYAVIATGGKQYRVEEGQQLNVERVGKVDDVVDLNAVLVVDGANVLSTKSELANASVKAKIVADAVGPKIDGFVYKNKSNNRKRWGHRQKLATIEITEIKKG